MRVSDFDVLRQTNDCVIAEVTLRTMFSSRKRQVFAPRGLLFYKWRFLDNGAYAPEEIEDAFIAWQARNELDPSEVLLERQKVAASTICGVAPAKKATPADRQGFEPFGYTERN